MSFTDKSASSDNRIAASQPIAKGNERGLGVKLVSGTAANFGGQCVLFLLTFFSSPYIIRNFGEELYGVLVLLITYVSLFTLLELGINASLVKYTAELLAVGRDEEVEGYLGTALALFSVTAVVISAATGLFAPLIVVKLFKVPAPYFVSAVFGLRVSSIAFALQFISQAYASVPIALQRFDLVNAIEVSGEATRILGWIAAVALGWRLRALVVIVLLTSVYRLLAFAFTAHRLAHRIRLLPRFSPAHFRSILHFSKYLVVGKVACRIAESCDKFLIGYFLPLSFVSFYAVPYALSQKLWVVVGNITTVVFPAASGLSTNSEDGRLKELYLRSTKAVAALIAFPALALCWWGDPLLRYWISPEFATYGAWSLRILLLGFLLNSFSHVPNFVSLAIGHPELGARFALVYLVGTVVFFSLLIPRFGIVGASLGFLFTQLVMVPGYAMATNRLVGVSHFALLRRAYAPILLPLTVALIVCGVAGMWVRSLPTLALAFMLGALVYYPLVYLAVMDSVERLACKQAFFSAIPSSWQVKLGLDRKGDASCRSSLS